MALSNKSANAVLARARAMYGKMLNEKDYENLIACNTIPEIVAYLKSNTRYSKALLKVNEKDAHRGMIESILKREIFLEAVKLAKYDASLGDKLYNYILQGFEINEINHFLIFYAAGKVDQYVFTVPLFFDKYTEISLKGLTLVKNYNDILASVEKTPYYDILKKYKPKSPSDTINLETIENDLSKLLYNNLFSIISKYAKGNEKREIEDYFYSDIDFMNFERIIRLKKYFEFSSEEIKRHLIHFGSLTEKQIDLMCNASSSKEVFKIMKTSLYGKYLSKMDLNYSGEASEKITFKKCKKNIHFSVYPSIVMLSYLVLSKNEIRNITTIIESVRYGVKPDVYKKLLIY